MKGTASRLMEEKDHEKQAKIREELEPFNNRLKKENFEFFLEHPTSYVTLDQMRFYVSKMRLDSIKMVYSNFSEAMKATKTGQEILSRITGIQDGMPENAAAPFTKTDIDGRSLPLSDFKGKYVLLDFWASWCVPCRKGNPHLISLYNRYKNKGFEIIGVADDDRKKDVWKAAVEKDNIGIWRHILRGANMELIMKGLPNPEDLDHKYGIATLPTKILIDPDGQIIGRYGNVYGEKDADLDKKLETLLGK